MKPYSRDLRQRIINAYTKQEGSQRQIAQRFGVSLSFVQGLLKRYRSCGTLEPKPHGGGQSPKLNPEQMSVVAELVQKNKGATLLQLCYQLEQITGVRVSRPTMGRIIKKLNLSRRRKNRKNKTHRQNKSTGTHKHKTEITQKQPLIAIAKIPHNIEGLSKHLTA
ncbi:MAG: transposase [Calothrix sp. MO_167.B12]|nr:transposase [Calothrix sp. MO_167.B12]